MPLSLHPFLHLQNALDHHIHNSNSKKTGGIDNPTRVAKGAISKFEFLMMSSNHFREDLSGKNCAMSDSNTQ